MTETPFSGIRLLSAPGEVMIPKAATDALVDAAVEQLGDRPARVADVGTGSGAIAVSLGLRAPKTRVWATDVSDAAVELARANVLRHRLTDRISVLRGDLLEGVPGDLDLVVANLPYLPERLRPQRPELAGEPFGAVFAPGDGLGHYRRLLGACAPVLRPDGALLIQLHRRVIAITAAELGVCAVAA